MGVRVWIFAGLLVLIFFVGHFVWHFAGLSPASSSPTNEPSWFEQQYLKCIEICIFKMYTNVNNNIWNVYQHAHLKCVYI